MPPSSANSASNAPRNWRLRALSELGVLSATRVAPALRAIQMDRAYAVEQLPAVGGVAMYRRTIGGEQVDFCAAWRGLTYHAASIREAIRGLASKRARARTDDDPRAPLTLSRCRREYGMCESGLRSFAESVGLDPAGAYTRAEIRARLTPDVRATYESDLRTAAII